MLSLMCILYRGAGSLPGDRAGIYSRCAELLLGKWDESRRIHHELQAGHLVEPAVRHLAWWLFNSQDSRGAVTERALIDEAAKFLHGRGFESVEEARTAAREFVEFCGGRMWVLSNAGTTADGEKLYSFTHRTFLEYFAAAHLATVSDTPEDLACVLAPNVIGVKGWNLVGQLAIQIKNRSSDRGADRIYATLLNPELIPREPGPLLTFLGECLESARPSPITVRNLSRVMLDYRLADDTPMIGIHPLLLLRHSGNYKQLIADEMNTEIANMVVSDDKATRVEGLLIALEIGQGDATTFWSQWSAEQANRYAAEISAEATHSSRLRAPAIDANVISLEQALEMPGGLGTLMEIHPQLLFAAHAEDPYLVSLYFDLMNDLENKGSQLWYRPRPSAYTTSEDAIGKFALVGHYLASKPDLPWALVHRHEPRTTMAPYPHAIINRLDDFSGLGIAAVHGMFTEIDGSGRIALSTLPMPTQFKKLFRDWKKGSVNLVEFLM
jgi:hypothetical protein